VHHPDQHWQLLHHRPAGNDPSCAADFLMPHSTMTSMCFHWLYSMRKNLVKAHLAFNAPVFPDTSIFGLHHIACLGICSHSARSLVFPKLGIVLQNYEGKCLVTKRKYFGDYKLAMLESSGHYTYSAPETKNSKCMEGIHIFNP
jgi:hypothetical protein